MFTTYEMKTFRLTGKVPNYLSLEEPVQQHPTDTMWDGGIHPGVVKIFSSGMMHSYSLKFTEELYVHSHSNNN